MRDLVASEQASKVVTADQSVQAPMDGFATTDNRVLNAWGAWLGALATNAEAALAAALAYRQLEDRARDSWLAAVEIDADRLEIPRVAVFAPLLAVEVDPERRLRILKAMGPSDESSAPTEGVRGLVGQDERGLRVCVVIAPLYLEFVQVLACGYRAGHGFEWVRHDPILCRDAAPVESQVLEGAVLEDIPLKALIDELAHAVVAHKSSERPLPEALSLFAHLSDAQDSGAVPLLDLR
jgi:hypothetical protein